MMARGTTSGDGGKSVAAMEMTKWFDTNYHYLVPEFAADQAFCQQYAASQTAPAAAVALRAASCSPTLPNLHRLRPG